MPCDWRNVSVDVSVQDSLVIVNECLEGGDVNCLCEIDNTFLVSYMGKGTYTFVFSECGKEVHRGRYTI
ncbi:MAG: hypothetical protein IJ745_06010 [Bacteroidales bacterium]|nr:hypothetical protein [Bacteroidales bacterium]